MVILNYLVSIPNWFNYKLSETPFFVSAFRVSIPNWFNYKTGYILTTLCDLLFQSQTGSITSCIKVQPRLFILLVSIPNWFNYKEEKMKRLLEIMVVSIPNWFNYKTAQNVGKLILYAFQSQTGSITSIKSFDKNAFPSSFNPKAVLNHN